MAIGEWFHVGRDPLCDAVTISQQRMTIDVLPTDKSGGFLGSNRNSRLSLTDISSPIELTTQLLNVYRSVVVSAN